MNCDFNSKLFSFASGSLMQENSDVWMGQNLSYCHALLPKICENGVATKVGDVYTRGNTPRIH